jgi:hypothetical protein
MAGGLGLKMNAETNYSSRMLEYMRAGGRVNSRVAISLEWEEAGQIHIVEGFTVDISTRGCLAIVPQGFAVGQKLRLKHKMNQRCAEAILIWRGHEGRSGWELGLELVSAPADFWEVEF